MDNVQRQKRNELTRQRVAAKLKQQRQRVERAPAVLAAQEAEKRRYIKTGVRCKRLDLTWRARISQAVKVELSPGVPPKVAAMRNGKCHECAHSTLRRHDMLHFCECCGCGHWTFDFPVPGLRDLGADLESKNEHAAHSCPKEVPEFTEYIGEENHGSS